MNKVILLGNLTADPEVKTYKDNSFTVFTVAVQDGYGDKKKTYFLDCVASGKAGENIAKYFDKGKPILVEGKLYTKKNEESGYKENRISIYSFSFINGGGDGKKKKNTRKPREEENNSYDDEEVPF